MGEQVQFQEDVLAHLLGVISRATGYTIDELDRDFELEADLGIDSVKQAEIWAEFSANYGLDHDETLVRTGPRSIAALAQRFASQIQQSGIEVKPLSATEAAAADPPGDLNTSEQRGVVRLLQRLDGPLYTAWTLGAAPVFILPELYIWFRDLSSDEPLVMLLETLTTHFAVFVWLPLVVLSASVKVFLKWTASKKRPSRS